MDQPYIPSWILYLVMESKTLCVYAIIICTTLGYIAFLKADTTRLKAFRWLLRGFSGVCGIIILIALFMPSVETLLLMYVNQFVTPENLEEAKAFVQMIITQNNLQ